MNRKLLIRHLCMIGGLVLLILFIWKCPLDYLFGIPCPCCGMTRAFKKLVQFDLMGALSCHPLLIPTGLALLYMIHRNVLPGRFKRKPRTEKILGAVLILLLAGLYIYRIGFEPEGVIKFHPEDGLIFRLFFR